MTETRLIPPPSSPPPLVVGRVSSLERDALRAWRAWGVYAKWTTCGGCGAIDYCRASRASGPFLCLDCWDQR
jgi:hypothetical protein